MVLKPYKIVLNQRNYRYEIVPFLGTVTAVSAEKIKNKVKPQNNATLLIANVCIK